MAWDAFKDKVLTMGMMTLRETNRFARLVRQDYDEEARARRGETISVPFGEEDDRTYDIEPSHNPLEPHEAKTGEAQIKLDIWRGANFRMTDRERAIIMANDAKNSVAMEKVRALSNYLDAQIAAATAHGGLGVQNPGFYSLVGTKGTTPFAQADSIEDAIACKQALTRTVCPREGRVGILSLDAEENALNQPNFRRVDERGDADPLMMGTLGRVSGIQWYGDNHHTPEHESRYAGSPTVNGALEAGARSAVVDHGAGGANTQRLSVGDVIWFGGGAGIPQDGKTYVVTEVTSGAGESTTGIKFFPSLREDVVDDTEIHSVGSHGFSPVFHPSAIQLVSRVQDMASEDESDSEMEVITDPVTGVSLRLEIIRQRKQVVWEWDILCGVAVVRPQFGARLLQ